MCGVLSLKSGLVSLCRVRLGLGFVYRTRLMLWRSIHRNQLHVSRSCIYKIMLGTSWHEHQVTGDYGFFLVIQDFKTRLYPLLVKTKSPTFTSFISIPPLKVSIIVSPDKQKWSFPVLSHTNLGTPK